MSFIIEDKVALVTGGGRDIGRACCLELAANGADVVVNYHSSSEAALETVADIEALGRRAVAVRADVTKPDDILALKEAAVDFGAGRVDILVNNAGGIIRRAFLADLDPELLAETLRLNFTSVALLCQAIIPVMAEHGGGKVINISSIAGHNGGAPTTPHYGPAKAAVSNFARTLTKEFAFTRTTLRRRCLRSWCPACLSPVRERMRMWPARSRSSLHRMLITSAAMSFM